MANTTSVLRGMLGAADRKILRRAGWVLAPATAIVVASLIGARLAPDTSTKKFLDNLHWTTSYGAAAMLAWFGVRSSATEEALARKCFAWALTFYVVGQVLWDIQVAVDWNPFPGPSDGGFLLLGPLSGAGLVLFLRRDTSPSQRRTAALDVAGLCAAVLALTLALYLPRRGEQALLQMGFLVAYPVVLSWAACVGLILALVLHLKPHLGWVLFLLALLVNGGLWLQWNSLTLDNALQDGTWYNALFSGTALAQGIGALLWRADVSTSRRWERFCEGFLRSLPLFGVVVSSAAVIFAYTIPGVPAAVKDSALVGGLVVVLLATVRQSLLLGESERLIQTERELRTSERKYRATLDLIPIPVCITTHPEGKLIELNLSFTQTFGVARERGLGKRPSDLGLWTDTKDRDRFVADMMASGQGQVQAFETTWKTPDGSLRPSLLTAALTDLNGALHCVFAIVDIGERKRAEAAIRQSEEKYRLLVEQAADGIFITDTRGTYVDVNSSGAEMMGMSRDEVIGHTIADLVAEDELERISAEISDLHAGLTVNREWRLKRKDGSVFWADVTAKMLPDGRLQGIVRDISDRKQGDEERRALEMQLSQSQKMQAVGSLAAGIAHDFNNILSAIRGNADLAAQDVGPDHPALESLQEIQKAGRRAANLVQQIVAFSRPRKPSSEIVSLPQIVDEVVRLLRSTLPAAVEMTTAYEKDAPAVQADPTQIHQVLVNLCTNASQAMEGHPGRIEIRLGRRTLPGPVALDLSPGEYACITVSDTGKG
ncbi:MAG TPA: PAS domain S-box protein, partial [Polyangiaceae bacterium]|nr:PAS domain S-box protein [Polyangiaceae bacterium]